MIDPISLLKPFANKRNSARDELEHVQVKGKHYVATNSYMLAEIVAEHAEDKPEHYVHVHTYTHEDAETIHYPEWQSIVPDEKTLQAVIYINPEYVLEMAKLAKALTKNDIKRMRIEYHGVGNPLVFKTKSNRLGMSMRGYIAPMLNHDV